MLLSIKSGICIYHSLNISAPAQIANEVLAQQREDIIKSKKYASLYQKWDLYIPFIENGLILAAPKGIVTMIVPYPLTNQTYGKKLRELILKDYTLFELCDLNGTKIFDNATVSNCIPFIRKEVPTKDNETNISHIHENKQISHDFNKSASELMPDIKTAVWNVGKETRNANRHANMHVLGDFCYISVGMVLNADEKTAKGEFTKEDLISLTQDDIHCREYIEAKDIEKYAVNRVRYLEYNTKRCPNKLRRPTFRELYERNKLMFNRLGKMQVYYDENHFLTSDAMFCCLLWCDLHGVNNKSIAASVKRYSKLQRDEMEQLSKENHFLTSDAMFCCLLWCDLHGVNNKSIAASVKRYSKLQRDEMEQLSKDVDLRFLLGIMNSRYADVLLTNLRGGDYHIYPEHIRNIPIPIASKEEQLPIIKLANSILTAKRENPSVDTIEQEREIDKIVYQLYGLTEDEIRIIEQK